MVKNIILLIAMISAIRAIAFVKKKERPAETKTIGVLVKPLKALSQ